MNGDEMRELRDECPSCGTVQPAGNSACVMCGSPLAARRRIDEGEQR